MHGTTHANYPRIYRMNPRSILAPRYPAIIGNVKSNFVLHVTKLMTFYTIVPFVRLRSLYLALKVPVSLSARSTSTQQKPIIRIEMPQRTWNTRQYPFPKRCRSRIHWLAWKMHKSFPLMLIKNSLNPQIDSIRLFGFIFCFVVFVFVSE